MATGVTFTPEAAKRIAAATRKVERMPVSKAGALVRTFDPHTEFYALVLASDPAARYTIQPVTPDPSSLNPAAVIIMGTDAIRWGFDGEAFRDAGREANGNPNVPWMAVVRARFCGYDPEGGPVFVFISPKVELDYAIPPHDHEDNANGGFAFAVFHPGTDVPSLPWAL